MRVASESLGALDADAGARLRAVASDAAVALAETRDEVQAAVRAYVASVRAYVADVSAQLAEAKAWFDTFAGIGSVVKSMLGDLATSLPSVDAPAPPALRVAELNPQVVPDVSAAVAAAGAAAAAAADARRRRRRRRAAETGERGGARAGRVRDARARGVRGL